jgi:hypothetical protein
MVHLPARCSLPQLNAFSFQPPKNKNRQEQRQAADFAWQIAAALAAASVASVVITGGMDACALFGS